MAINTNPVFCYGTEEKSVTISTANANRDGTTGTYGTLLTAPTGGCKVTEIKYKAGVTTTAGMIRIFISDSAGANPRLFDEMTVSAITASATVATATGRLTFSDLDLKAGQIITVSTEKAESINVFAQVGYFDTTI